MSYLYGMRGARSSSASSSHCDVHVEFWSRLYLCHHQNYVIQKKNPEHLNNFLFFSLPTQIAHIICNVSVYTSGSKYIKDAWTQFLGTIMVNICCPDRMTKQLSSQIHSMAKCWCNTIRPIGPTYFRQNFCHIRVTGASCRVPVTASYYTANWPQPLRWNIIKNLRWHQCHRIGTAVMRTTPIWTISTVTVAVRPMKYLLFPPNHNRSWAAAKTAPSGYSTFGKYHVVTRPVARTTFSC